MAIEFSADTKRFKISYQSPFGGIDSSAFASQINPANFAAIKNGLIDSNILTPINWVEVINQAMAASSGAYLGYIPVSNSSTVGYLISSTGVTVIASDGNGGFTYTTPETSTYAPALSTYGYFSYIVIDNQLIWTCGSWSEIWTYDITTQTTSNLTTYVGGGILGELNNQVVNLGGYSSLDGKIPYRISWSAPGEYGQFKPYDTTTNTGNYDAGFNDLPSTSDVLQGIITVGTVAYIFRSQGISQMTPTGNGTDPFQFNHLWASELGIGTTLPDSISQYGSMGAFISESGIYTLGISGLQTITGSAAKFLYAQINNVSLFAKTTPLPAGAITARCVPYLFSTPGVYYVIGILNSVTSNVGQTSVAGYNFYAIDLNNGNACYSLGALNIAANNPSTAAANATGKLSYINTNYQTAPVPAPPTPVYQTTWVPDTYYWPSGYILVASSYSSLFPAPQPVNQIYQVLNAGAIAPDPAVYDESTRSWSVDPLLIQPPAIGQTTEYGNVQLKYVGPAQWEPDTEYNVGAFTIFTLSTETGSRGQPFGYVYKCTQTGVSAATQEAWSTGNGSTQADGTASWECLGAVTGVLSAQDFNPAVATYNLNPNGSIIDSNGATQQINPTAVLNTIQGGFSQEAAPAWLGLGQVTQEARVLPNSVPAAPWTCIAEPLPPAVVPTINLAKIVPLFVGIQNNILGANTNTFVGSMLAPPVTTAQATFTFRKEQLKFGMIPTVTKVGVIAQLIDGLEQGIIQVSVDGGQNYDFAPINILPGVAPSGFSTFYSDAVKSLERPQLSFILQNVQLAEAYYQGTLADYDLI